ncbi:MAG: hypothetical protein EOL87_13170 [Spartobacteria bacterium]|nr:hypothetical protein [Spartobacteria bacterium]
MGKLIKPLVVIILVLAAVALFLEWKVYKQRSLLKLRTQKLEAGYSKMAKSVRYDDFSRSSLAVSDVSGLGVIDKSAKDIAAQGDILFSDLQSAQSDVQRLQGELATAQQEIQNGIAELAAAKEAATRAQNSMQAARNEVDQIRGQINVLEGEKEQLGTEVDDLNALLAEKSDTIQDLQDELLTQKATVKKFEDDLMVEAGMKTVPEGLGGNVVSVNASWNFVVLDIGRKAGLIPDVDMLAYRDDQLIGKLFISAVSDDMAIGEILPDWSQSAIQEGDHVLF